MLIGSESAFFLINKRKTMKNCYKHCYIYLSLLIFSSYTTVQNVLGRFQVSKDVYVKSFKQHAFDPLLSNKTTDYYHEILYLKKHNAKVEVLHKRISIFYNVSYSLVEVEDKTMHITITFRCHTRTKSTRSFFYQIAPTLFER